MYKPRGFSNVEEMNEAIVERWNAVVKPNDMVVHLGDTFLNDNARGLEYFKRLNGQISIVWGNHDTDTRKKLLYVLPNVIALGYAHMFKHKKLSIYVSHYPSFTANYDERFFSQHVINLHGHIHSQTPWTDPANPFMYDVGMDAHNCTPVHIDQVLSDIRNKWEEISHPTI